MPRKGHNEEQIMRVLAGESGKKVADVCRKAGVSEATYRVNQWRAARLVPINRSSLHRDPETALRRRLRELAGAHVRWVTGV